MYRVFHRTFWKHNPEFPNGLEPHLGRKTTICHVDTEEQAQEECRVYNKNHDPGRFSRKAEYERC